MMINRPASPEAPHDGYQLDMNLLADIFAEATLVIKKSIAGAGIASALEWLQKEIVETMSFDYPESLQKECVALVHQIDVLSLEIGRGFLDQTTLSDFIKQAKVFYEEKYPSTVVADKLVTAGSVSVANGMWSNSQEHPLTQIINAAEKIFHHQNAQNQNGHRQRNQRKPLC